MITPQEIELKEFSRSVRGYDRDEVDEFLDVIILDLQDLLASVDEIKKENEELKAEIEEHKKSQQKVMDTLESAKRLMKDMSDSAEKRADIIIQNAKMDAELILNEARSAAPQTNSVMDGSELHEKVLLFKNRYRQLLKDELDNLDSKSNDLLSELEKEFMPTSTDTQIMSFSDIADDKISVTKATLADGELSLKEADDLIAKLENEADELAKKTDLPRAKDTVVLDADAIDELLEKKAEN